MKTFTKYIAILFITSSITSCVNDDNFTIPTLGEDKQYVNLKSLSEIVDLYNGSLINFDAYIQAANLTEITTYGYVVSNDRAGNFFKTLVIQDKPENPTVGVEVRIDQTNLNASYNVGRKIYIKLSGPDITLNGGLALAKRFDTYQIGINNSFNTSVDRIGVNDYTNFIDRSSEIATIIPTKVNLGQITDNYINTLVELENIQSLNEGETFANPNNTFSVNRNLKNCETDETIVLRTSGFASFKSLEIPSKKGSITALLNKFGNNYQLFIRDPSDLNFTQDRCTSFYEENFSAQNFNQWTIQNIQGSQTWEIETFGNPAPSAKISGFQNGAQNNEDWLISKAIDLSTVTGTLYFSFDNLKRFEGQNIEVYYTTNYNGGNPNDTVNIWTQLSPIIDTNTDSWASWTNSGNLNISEAIGGHLFIAFKYTSTTAEAATFQIDNIKIIQS